MSVTVKLRTLAACAVLAACMMPAPARAYSVMTHEEVVDMAWLPHIVPLLRARFPDLTDDQLREAHAYAYGGCVLQDLGYYPNGSHFFSGLTHYVRSGEFVANLLADATTPDELGFALGALAHGPLNALKLKLPDSDQQDLYIRSVNETVDRLDTRLDALRDAPTEVMPVTLKAIDLDTGKATTPGEYRLADETYAELLDHVAGKPSAAVPASVRADLLNYFAPSHNGDNKVSAKPKDWSRVQKNVAQLQATSSAPQSLSN